MENTLFDLLKKIKKEEFGTIAYFAETDTKETKFKDFEYFEIEKKRFNILYTKCNYE